VERIIGLSEDTFAYNRETMTLIRGVLFDYGLVLSGPPDPVAWERIRSLLGADEGDFHAAYWRRRLDYDRGTFDGPGYWRETAQELGRSLSEAELATLLALDVELWTRPNQVMIDWAAEVSGCGVRTGILSNMGDAMEAGIVRRFAWMSGFTHSTFSHRVGSIKPEAAIYRDAIEGLGVPAEQVLFVDDREENVLAARANGMHALVYADHASFLKSLREAGFEGLPFPAAG
jgi:putative hydrolase of the HAD superfamily